jgi:hypothetical protein
MTDNDCPICQETLHGYSSVGCTVPCGHVFHRSCFETWQIHSTARRCPCCNEFLTGFIARIHITLPETPTPSPCISPAESLITPTHTIINTCSSKVESRPNIPYILDEPSMRFQRRQALSNEKTRQGKMRRIRNQLSARNYRIDKSAAEDGDAKCAQPDVVPSCCAAAAVRAGVPSTSLSASLQREDYTNHEKRCTAADTCDDKDSVSKPHNKSFTKPVLCSSLDTAKDAANILLPYEERIPDVADKIMKEIEKSFQTNVTFKSEVNKKYFY